VGTYPNINTLWSDCLNKKKKTFLPKSGKRQKDKDKKKIVIKCSAFLSSIQSLRKLYFYHCNIIFLVFYTCIFFYIPNINKKRKEKCCNLRSIHTQHMQPNLDTTMYIETQHAIRCAPI
jgi:hypothetical protein